MTIHRQCPLFFLFIFSEQTILELKETRKSPTERTPDNGHSNLNSLFIDANAYVGYLVCVCLFSTSSSSQNWPKYVVHFRLPRKIVVISRQYTIHNAQRTRKKKERKKGTEREEGSLNSFILHAHCPVINGIVSVIFLTASIHPTGNFKFVRCMTDVYYNMRISFA